MVAIVGCAALVHKSESAAGAGRRLYVSSVPLLRQSAQPRASAYSAYPSVATRASRGTRFLSTPSTPIAEASPSPSVAQHLLQALQEVRQERRNTYFSEDELQALKRITHKDWNDINRYAEMISGDFNKDKAWMISGGRMLETQADYERLLQKFVPDYLAARSKIGDRYETYLEYAQRLLKPQTEVEQIPAWQAYFEAAHTNDEPESFARVVSE